MIKSTTGVKNVLFEIAQIDTITNGNTKILKKCVFYRVFSSYFFLKCFMFYF